MAAARSTNPATSSPPEFQSAQEALPRGHRPLWWRPLIYSPLSHTSGLERAPRLQVGPHQSACDPARRASPRAPVSSLCRTRRFAPAAAAAGDGSGNCSRLHYERKLSRMKRLLQCRRQGGWRGAAPDELSRSRAVIPASASCSLRGRSLQKKQSRGQSPAESRKEAKERWQQGQEALSSSLSGPLLSELRSRTARLAFASPRGLRDDGQEGMQEDCHEQP